MTATEEERRLIEALTKKLVDDGKIIEAGWVAMRQAVIPKDVSEDQLHDMRMAYFAGAQHLYASIMIMLGPGDEPTATDLRRMKQIDTELNAFVAKLRRLLDA